MPASIISIDRLVIDAGLAALTVGFLYHSEAPSSKLFFLLACAALTRETGMLLIAAYCAYLLARRLYRASALFSLSAIPTILWYVYVRFKTASQPYGFSLIPLSAILRVLEHPWHYPAGTPLVAAVHVADYLALVGVLVGFILAVVYFVREPFTPASLLAMLFAVTGTFVQRTDHWQNVYDFGRVYTPLFLCLSAVAARDRNPWFLAPILLMLPRIAIQLTPQVLGVVRWI